VRERGGKRKREKERERGRESWRERESKREREMSVVQTGSDGSASLIYSVCIYIVHIWTIVHMYQMIRNVKKFFYRT
jgi:hypothetical protein